MIIDSHCHLDYPNLYNQLDAVVNRAEQNQVKYLLTICTTLESFERIKLIIKKYKNIYGTFGIHPHESNKYPQVDSKFISNIKKQHNKIIGIGETGLDYYYENSKKNIQIESFLKHIYVSQKTDIPIIIHAREADKDIINILNAEYKKEPFNGVIHCFTSSYELAKSMLNIGFYISFSGIITFKNANDIRESCKKIPIESILIETDAPYLAPVPYRGKRNEPSYITKVLNKISEIKDIDRNDVDKITTNNFFNLFKKASL